MTDVIILMILIILIGAAVSYIVKEKKNGTRCIGCPAGGNCPSSRKITEKETVRSGSGAPDNPHLRYGVPTLCQQCNGSA